MLIKCWRLAEVVERVQIVYLTSVADFLASAMRDVGLWWKEHLTIPVKACVQVPSTPLNSLVTLDLPSNLSGVFSPVK